MMIALCIALIILDRITKILTINLLKPIESIVLIPKVLSLTYVENRGAAFGIMQNARWIFVVVTVAVLAALCVYIVKTKPQSRLFKWSAALIGAGAVGNLIDRICYGYVVDMIQATFIDFPVFNFADCCIVVGTGLLCLYILTKKDD